VRLNGRKEHVLGFVVEVAHSRCYLSFFEGGGPELEVVLEDSPINKI